MAAAWKSRTRRVYAGGDAAFRAPTAAESTASFTLSVRYSSSVKVFWAVRYLVKAKVKNGCRAALLRAIDNKTLGKGSIAGEEYLHNMQQARIDNDVATWVECCFCDPPLAEERPYWEEYFELLAVKDAHARRNCRHENGTEPWACCDCDCTVNLERTLAGKGADFLNDLRASARQPAKNRSSHRSD